MTCWLIMSTRHFASMSTVRQRPDARGLHRRDDVLVDHVHEALRLDVHGPRVVIVEDVLTALALLLRQDLHLLEELDVLVGRELGDGLDAGVDAPDAAIGELLL